MSRDNSSGCNTYCSSPAELLNQDCYCTTLNREQLDRILRTDDLNQDVLATHPQLFSSTAVFISSSQLRHIRDIIRAVERVISLPAYAQEIVARSPYVANYGLGTSGVFMGYDFHLGAQGPQVVEINTNAGGAFLNSALLNAQTECCRTIGTPLPQLNKDLDQEFLSMFMHEWQLQRPDKPLITIAIVDEQPSHQFLYPEFKMAQRLFQRNGINAIIVDPSELQFTDHKLTCNGLTIDLVYNRLTDFSLTSHSVASLREAFEAGATVLTPNPYHHAMYADKRNLIILSDVKGLAKLGAEESDIEILRAGIPATQAVTKENSDTLWSQRKCLFFKPASGFGGRAIYRGDKITKRVWQEVLRGNYVAQQIVLPCERGVIVDSERTALKMDIRAYVYEGEIQLLAARLYQGQTTNFRTQGGGFAPVFVA